VFIAASNDPATAAFVPSPKRPAMPRDPNATTVRIPASSASSSAQIAPSDAIDEVMG